MGITRKRKPTRTKQVEQTETKEQLIEKLLDLIEPDIAWHESNSSMGNHIKECIQVYRQIRPKEGRK